MIGALGLHDGRAVSESDDRPGAVWDAETRTMIPELSGHQGRVVSAVFSLDGRRVVTASADGTARVWDVDKEMIAELRGHQDSVYSAVFSLDGRRVVTASGDRVARVWEAEKGTLIAELHGD